VSSFLYGLAGVAMFVVVAPLMQGLARRGAWRVSPVVVLAIAAILAHLASIWVGLAQVRPFQYWNAAAIFGFGVMTYVFAFGAVYKSVSLRLLLDLTERPGNAMKLSAIVGDRIPEIVRERIDVLIDSGLVARDDGMFVTTSAGHQIATRLRLARRMLAIGSTGLYDFTPSASLREKS
jgi:hypothetical protein